MNSIRIDISSRYPKKETRMYLVDFTDVLVSGWSTGVMSVLGLVVDPGTVTDP